jgi:hypothetical protein
VPRRETSHAVNFVDNSQLIDWCKRMFDYIVRCGAIFMVLIMIWKSSRG